MELPVLVQEGKVLARKGHRVLAETALDIIDDQRLACYNVVAHDPLPLQRAHVIGIVVKLADGRRHAAKLPHRQPHGAVQFAGVFMAAPQQFVVKLLPLLRRAAHLESLDGRLHCERHMRSTAGLPRLLVVVRCGPVAQR
eukprot:7380073-Prymnesium_polylepis.2